MSSPTQLCTHGRPRELRARAKRGKLPLHAIQAHADARRLDTRTAAHHSTRAGRTLGRQPNHTRAGAKSGHSASHDLLACRRIHYSKATRFPKLSLSRNIGFTRTNIIETKKVWEISCAPPGAQNPTAQQRNAVRVVRIKNFHFLKNHFRTRVFSGTGLSITPKVLLREAGVMSGVRR